MTECQLVNTFAEWLMQQLEERDWSQAELARRAGVTRQAISNLINSNRQVGPEVANGIALALGLPPEEVFRKAGLIPDHGDNRKVAERIASYKLSDLSKEQLEEIIGLIDWIVERDEKRSKTRKPKYRTNREGEAPPEVLK